MCCFYHIKFLPNSFCSQDLKKKFQENFLHKNQNETNIFPREKRYSLKIAELSEEWRQKSGIINCLKNTRATSFSYPNLFYDQNKTNPTTQIFFMSV